MGDCGRKCKEMAGEGEEMKSREIGQCEKCKWFHIPFKSAIYFGCKNKYAADNLYMKGMMRRTFGCWYWREQK